MPNAADGRHRGQLLLRAASIVICYTVFTWPDSTSAQQAQHPTVGPNTHWNRHTIDDSFDGADGVRLADFNGDKLPDIVTGWEESGLVRLYLHPGKTNSRRPWPAVTIAKHKFPEDAVPCDVDGDGKLDVLSCHEGRERQVYVHWNDANEQRASELLSASNWSSSVFKQLSGRAWMYAVPLGQIAGRNAIVVGSKGSQATITLLLQKPGSGRSLEKWQALDLRKAGWIMSLEVVDIDQDGRQDILFSDRKGEQRCVAWLQQPNSPQEPWIEHTINNENHEFMFLDILESGQILIATRNQLALECAPEQIDKTYPDWPTTTIALPIRNGKSIARLPSGQTIVTSNTIDAKPASPGIWMMESGKWRVLDPQTNVKFDRIELVDIDLDGDLDVLCCEERQDFGVFWYENPER